VEKSLGDGDDTAANGIELFCGSRQNPQKYFGSITSHVGPWGDWFNIRSCKRKPGEVEFLSKFATLVEASQGDRDDTSMNNIAFKCTDGEEQLLGDSPTSWGHWSTWTECPYGTAICGLETKVEHPRGDGDDTSLNDVKFYCCT